MTDAEDKYADFASGAPRDEDVSSLAGLVDQMARQEIAVEQAEERLREAKAALRDTAENLIPEKMADLGMATFETALGVAIKVEDKVHVTPKVDDRPKVLEWLEGRGQQALIKQTITAALNAGADEQADRIRATIAAEEGASVKTEKKVESGTLKKYVKGLLERGESVPVDILGLHQYKAAKITKRPDDKVFEGE